MSLFDISGVALSDRFRRLSRIPSFGPQPKNVQTPPIALTKHSHPICNPSGLEKPDKTISRSTATGDPGVVNNRTVHSMKPDMQCTAGVLEGGSGPCHAF